mmetsp:Transcript_9048/g.13485  ORF Transcript_9048/g.13485 Transcript_9048/m.13485 type:complete len:346 (-) Transcript_9048:95-1132(-)
MILKRKFILAIGMIIAIKGSDGSAEYILQKQHAQYDKSTGQCYEETLEKLSVFGASACKAMAEEENLRLIFAYELVYCRQQAVGKQFSPISREPTKCSWKHNSTFEIQHCTNLLNDIEFQFFTQEYTKIYGTCFDISRERLNINAATLQTAITEAAERLKESYLIHLSKLHRVSKEVELVGNEQLPKLHDNQEQVVIRVIDSDEFFSEIKEATSWIDKAEEYVDRLHSKHSYYGSEGYFITFLFISWLITLIKPLQNAREGLFVTNLLTFIGEYSAEKVLSLELNDLIVSNVIASSLRKCSVAISICITIATFFQWILKFDNSRHLTIGDLKEVHEKVYRTNYSR